MLKNLVLISQEKIQSSGKERFMEDTDFLIPWSPQEIFNIEGKNHMSKISTSLRISPTKGPSGTPNSKISFASIGNFGAFQECPIARSALHCEILEIFLSFAQYRRVNLTKLSIPNLYKIALTSLTD